MSYISEIRKKVGHDRIFMPFACGVIVRDGKILFQKRSDDGSWALNGGSLEFGETFEDALIREMKEELGIDVIDYELICSASGEATHHIYPNGDEIYSVGLIYDIKKYSCTITPDHDEVEEVAWFPLDKIPNNFFGPDKEVLKKVLEYYEKN